MKFLIFAVSILAGLSMNLCSGGVSDFLPSQAQTQNVSCRELSSALIESYSVVAGVGIGELKLGNSIENTIKTIKKKCGEPFVVYHPDYEYMDAEVSAGDNENVNNMTKGAGIRCYFKNDRLFQISVDSYLYSNDEITKNSLFNDVKKKYPDGRAFHLESSTEKDSKAIKRFSYWVVEKRGIAFELYETSEKLKLVSNIYLFLPNEEFFPLGTSDAPQFIKLRKD